MNNKRLRKIVVYIPLILNSKNAYTTTMINLLKKKYTVIGELQSLTGFISILRTKAVVLNWIEDSLNTDTKFRILLYKIMGAKIIWVMHNKKSHDNTIDSGNNIQWLQRVASKIVIHSLSSKEFVSDNYKKKVIFIPHVIYKSKCNHNLIDELRNRYKICADDFVFTFFGLIRPCKNIEYLIDSFKQIKDVSTKLIIIGATERDCIDYSQKIEMLSKTDHRIIFDTREIPREVLNGILYISDVVVLPYQTESYLNSGALVHALSLGKTVIAPSFAMSSDYEKNDLIYIYRNNLYAVMKDLLCHKERTRQKGILAKEYVEKYNNLVSVGDRLFRVID